MLKFLFDKIVSFLILLLILPILISICLITILVDGFPIIYSAERVGFKGKIFKIYKFRSMKNDSDEILGKWGRFIRKTNLDELLQFFNVLKGDMSIIGPRPHDKLEDVYFSQNIDKYDLRKSIKPGITGLSAVNGNRGGTDLKIIEKRVDFDLEYIEKQNFIFDLVIFFKTIVLIFKPNN